MGGITMKIFVEKFVMDERLEIPPLFLIWFEKLAGKFTEKWEKKIARIIKPYCKTILDDCVIPVLKSETAAMVIPRIESTRRILEKIVQNLAIAIRDKLTIEDVQRLSNQGYRTLNNFHFTRIPELIQKQASPNIELFIKLVHNYLKYQTGVNYTVPENIDKYTTAYFGYMFG